MGDNGYTKCSFGIKNISQESLRWEFDKKRKRNLIHEFQQIVVKAFHEFLSVEAKELIFESMKDFIPEETEHEEFPKEMGRGGRVAEKETICSRIRHRMCRGAQGKKTDSSGFCERRWNPEAF